MVGEFSRSNARQVMGKLGGAAKRRTGWQVRFIAPDFDGILWMILMSFFGNPKVGNWAKSV